MAADRQRIRVQPSQQRQPRPLRTGAGFSIVLPILRVVARHWEKPSYQAGDEGTMIVSGVGLGKEALSLTVEAEDERGGWSAVAKVRAGVDAEGKKAVATWTFPKAPVVPRAATLREADGSVLSNARFEDRRDLENAGTASFRQQVVGVGRGTGGEVETVAFAFEKIEHLSPKGDVVASDALGGS
jgi:hypothetical protein